MRKESVVMQEHTARFSARLLFGYWRPGGSARQRVTCEERIVLVPAGVKTLTAARKWVQRYARSEEYDFENTAEERIHFSCMQILDVIELGLEAGPEEVWYDICERVFTTDEFSSRHQQNATSPVGNRRREKSQSPRRR